MLHALLQACLYDFIYFGDDKFMKLSSNWNSKEICKFLMNETRLVVSFARVSVLKTVPSFQVCQNRLDLWPPCGEARERQEENVFPNAQSTKTKKKKQEWSLTSYLWQRNLLLLFVWWELQEDSSSDITDYQRIYLKSGEQIWKREATLHICLRANCVFSDWASVKLNKQPEKRLHSFTSAFFPLFNSVALLL